METLLTILREVRDPRDMNARHCCASMLFIALMATLCGAKTCVDIADFAAANEDDLAQIAGCRTARRVTTASPGCSACPAGRDGQDFCAFCQSPA